MKKITLYVEDEQHAFLKSKAGKTGTMSWYIRKVLTADMLRSADMDRRRKSAFPTISETEVN